MNSFRISDGYAAGMDRAAASTAKPPVKRGRPLSADRSDLIVNHAWELLQEQGYDGLRMSDVAERAGVGLATIYRRWPSKRELVHAALACASLPFALPSTDDPRNDVLVALTELARGLNTGGDQSVASYLSCAREDPEMGALWRKATTLKLDLYLRDRLAAVLGEDHPELAVRAQAGPAILLYQASIFGEQLDAEALAQQLTDMLFAGSSLPA
jgi:AcrR family transcriptional regulator